MGAKEVEKGYADLLEVPLPCFRTTWLLLPHALVLHSQAPKSPASGVKGA